MYIISKDHVYFNGFLLVVDVQDIFPSNTDNCFIIHSSVVVGT